jgi:hypothetical protein
MFVNSYFTCMQGRIYPWGSKKGVERREEKEIILYS